MAKQGTCWDGYVQEGMKKKGDRMVPNCVKSGKAASAKSKARARKSKAK